MQAPPRVSLPHLLPLGLAALAACGGGGSDGPDIIGGLVVYNSRTAGFATEPGAPLAVGDDWFVFLADEDETGATGTDFNGDLDADDEVATAYDVKKRVATHLRAAEDVAIIGSDVFLVTDELEDGQDWSGDGQMDDLVLLHWSPTTMTVAPVDELRRPDTVVAEGRLYYSAQRAVGMLETSLSWVDTMAPTTPVVVPAADASVDEDPVLLGEDEGLLLFYQDEGSSIRDLNGDGDTADGTVLGLLDATDPAAPARNTGLALAGSGSPVRARSIGPNDWLVALHVGELEQGNTNLNDPALFAGVPNWQPTQCATLEDTDTDDEVLHYIEFEAWVDDAVANPPVNTGLVGDRRVLVTENETSGRRFVATVSTEADEGACRLNGDMDQSDRVVRWVEVLAGNTFTVPGDFNDWLAIAQVPGGALGIAEVDDRWVAVVSEADDGRDHDGNPAADYDILGWLDPTAIGTDSWQFPMHAQNGTPLGVDWFGEQPERDGFLFTDIEEVVGIACNTGDNDMEDSFAVYGRFSPSNPDLVQWNGYCYATEPFNAGLVVIGNVAFLRADEGEQGRDLNEDGDDDDQVLLRHTVFPLGRLYHVATLNDLAGPSVVRGEGNTAVFLTDEQMAGRDLNQDGDELDHVVQFLAVD